MINICEGLLLLKIHSAGVMSVTGTFLCRSIKIFQAFTVGLYHTHLPKSQFSGDMKMSQSAAVVVVLRLAAFQ